jgi:glycosyltransferase involved in cell wall biosynthesis
LAPHRILFVHHRPQPSGAARSLALLIGALNSDWQSHVLVPDGGAARLFEKAGATVHRVAVPAFTHTWDVQYHGLRWLVALREATWLPSHARTVNRLLREVRPALVHVNDGVMLASGALGARAGVPVVWHLRSSLATEGRDRRSTRIVRWIDRYGSAAIAIDRDVAATFPLRIPVSVIPNPAIAQPGDAANLEIPRGRLAVGYFGYLRRQKGWPQFVQALRRLVDEGVGAQGVIVGGGVRPSSAFRGPRGRLLKALSIPDEEGDLDQLIRELNLEDRVTRIPFTDDAGSVMRALDVVVFPNQGAGLGRPVLEAAAYGVPVVAAGSADGGGVVDPNVTGLLVGPGPDELADALKLLLSDPQLRGRLATNAVQKAGAFDPARIAAQVGEVWSRVLAAR